MPEEIAPVLKSVNVGLPREVEWKGRLVSTAIYKSPVTGSIALGRLNLSGDKQADLKVHGGPTKVVYAYPSEHYDYWRAELSDAQLEWGMFGENFTTEGLIEDSVHIGDVYKVGTTRLAVTEPRMPCFKLVIRFDRPDMVKRFFESQRSGFYFGVLETGSVEAGDSFERLEIDSHGLTVAEVTRLYTTAKDDVSLLRKAVAAPALPDSWRGYFSHRLQKLE